MSHTFFLSKSKRFPVARSVAFGAGFALMAVEILAGRIAAPFIGASLFSWTAIIGSVLLGMALGNLIGGRLADRFAVRSSVAGFFLLGGGWVMLLPWLSLKFGEQLGNVFVSPLLTATVYSLVMFFPVALCAAAALPHLVKLDLPDLSSIGVTAGQIGAWQALGSLVGTFACGFIFLMYVGVRSLAWIFGGVWLCLAILSFFCARRVHASAAGLSDEAERQLPNETLPISWLLMFVGSFALMAVQLVSGRMMAPYLGVSVYSWTSAIGVTLLGIAAGQYAGGYLADRRLSRVTLGACFVLAGTLTLLANYSVPLVGSFLPNVGLPIWLKTFSFIAFAFFPPAALLATLSPQLLAWRTSSLSRVGSSVGALGAWSALGSIVGTYTVGYWLISFVGTKTLMTLLASGLLLIGLWLGRAAHFWKTRYAVLVGLFLVADFFLPGLCTRETNYYCLRVETKAAEKGNTYVLYLDHLVHSYVEPRTPEHLGYGYEQVYARLVALLNSPDQSFRTLFIGGGGYAFPRYLEVYYPKAESVVAEIDPGVTRANYDLMELSRATRIHSVNEDARSYLHRPSNEPAFSLVFGDAFNDVSVPFHLTTLEFHRSLKSRMTPDGIYALNVIDDARYGSFLSSMTRTLQAVWTHVYLAPLSSKIDDRRNTFVLLATDHALDLERWKKVQTPTAVASMRSEQSSEETYTILSPAELDEFLAKHSAPALTDDFVPTERYLAPVFRDVY